MKKDLGYGFYLESLDIKNNIYNYSLLFNDGVQMNDHVFRLGGMSDGFNKKPYCMLIDYGVYTSKLTDVKQLSSFGIHCIINTEGKIVLSSKDQFDSIYYIGGCIAKDKYYYYNLITGKVITRGNNSIESTYFLFISNAYSSLYKEDHLYPKGVYKVNWNTGEVEYFN